ncbi:MAG: hypothetical protein XD63_1131 [Thermoanaerobacterales bacterium 50_218]|nr:MAG: hypothetical protein XD63_1131 [Thermoanaerobacterales bacterium 50_218]HAA90140.1 DUF523 domain-containing protein [Peptococcaceae bacterium]
MKKILVSACLTGEPCAYDGRARTCEAIFQLASENRIIPVCPECLGGLPIPRPPAEIVNGSGEDVLSGRAHVINREGEDVTAAFVKGARLALEIAKREGIQVAILKARSPSCGYRQIYDGTFSGKLRPGHGVTVALLLEAGISIYTENEVGDLITCLKE